MGVGSSTSATASLALCEPLPTQFQFPAVVSRRFCSPRPVLLELVDGFSTLSSAPPEGFQVSEARCERAMFRLAAATAITHTAAPVAAELRDGKWLLDTYGVAVACLRQSLHRSVRRMGASVHLITYDVFLGTTNPRRLLTVQITLSVAAPPSKSQSARPGLRKRTRHKREPTLVVDFRDPVSGEQARFGCDGDWVRRRAAVLYVERGVIAKRQTIAKIFRANHDAGVVMTTIASAPFRQGTPYRVEIAPGVDAALITTLCAAMDDAITLVDGAHASHQGDRASESVWLGDGRSAEDNETRRKGPEGDVGVPVDGPPRRVHDRLRPSPPP